MKAFQDARVHDFRGVLSSAQLQSGTRRYQAFVGMALRDSDDEPVFVTYVHYGPANSPQSQQKDYYHGPNLVAAINTANTKLQEKYSPKKGYTTLAGTGPRLLDEATFAAAFDDCLGVRR